ncbi:MAG: hypothetical protein NT121_03435 [Chloroflexi bacterium]|nr:hypothetical protein [Chloroflexota bacterium]
MFENKEELTEFLVKEWNYLPLQAPDTAEKLLNMDVGIRDAFEKWLGDKEFPNTPVFSGFSPSSLNKAVNIKPPAVFLLLDWIRREPKEALIAIKQEFSKHLETNS